MKSVFAFAFALVSCSANAAPVYLKCQLDLVGKAVESEDLAAKAPMDVTLNEDAGTVTYSFPTAGRTYTVRGAFTASQVAFNGFAIDRTNFAFQRTSFGVTDHGRCTMDATKRAF